MNCLLLNCLFVMGFGFAEKLIKILIENHSKIRVCFAIVLTIKFANNDFDRFFCLFLIDLAMLNAKHFLPSGNLNKTIAESGYAEEIFSKSWFKIIQESMFACKLSSYRTCKQWFLTDFSIRFLKDLATLKSLIHRYEVR